MHRETASRALLAAILLMFLGLASFYTWITPIPLGDAHNPDEMAHVCYARAVAAGRLPILRGDDKGEPGWVYQLTVAQGPPLYADRHILIYPLPPSPLPARR